MEEANLLLFDLLLWHNFSGFLRLWAGSNRSSLLLLFYRTWRRRKVSIIWFLVFLRYSKMFNTESTDKVTKPRLFPLLNALFLNSVPSYLPTGAVVADNMFWFHRQRDQLQKKTLVTERNERLESSLGQTDLHNTPLKQSSLWLTFNQIVHLWCLWEGIHNQLELKQARNLRRKTQLPSFHSKHQFQAPALRGKSLLSDLANTKT